MGKKLTKAQATAYLHTVASQHGEAFIVEWLEQRLGKPGVPRNMGPIEVGDTVRVLPRKPGQGPGYTDYMEQYAGGFFLVKNTTTGRQGSLAVLAGMPGFHWHPDWLEKVE